MWKGNDAGREEGEGKWSRPATQIRLACLPSFLMDPLIYVRGAGSNNIFSELVLISCHTWRKGGGEEESDMRSLDSTVCVLAVPPWRLPASTCWDQDVSNRLKKTPPTCHCSFSEDSFCQVALL